MKQVNKKLLSVCVATALGVGLVTLPAYAEGEMTISAPKYYRIVDEKAVSGYDALDPVEAPVDGQFSDMLTYGTDTNYGPIYGTFKSEVEVANGSGKSAVLFAAVYDEEGRVKSVTSDAKAISESADTLSVNSTVEEGETYKTFIWDAENGLTPLQTEVSEPTLKYFYCDDPGTVSIAWYDEGGSYTVYKNGVQVVSDPSTLTTYSALSLKNMGKYPIYVYTDETAVAGDKYVVKNDNVACDELEADFTSGAYLINGEYLIGRNMAYLRNDDAQWYHNSVSKHLIIDGVDCETSVYRVYDANGTTKEKWTNNYYKVNTSFLSGSGVSADVKIDYFDVQTEGDASPIQLHYPTASGKAQKVLVNMENDHKWKSYTYRIEDGQFDETGLYDEGYQMALYGRAIAKVTVTPIYDTSVKTLRAANVYSDGVELRWTVASQAGITGYTIKRDDEVIAQNYQLRTYYDEGLDGDTEYQYTITPESTVAKVKESDGLIVKTSQSADPITMTLPVDSDEGTLESATTVSDPSGISFTYLNANRWDDAMTVVRTKGGKDCRMTVARNTSNPRTGDLWYDIYTWSDPPKSKLRPSYLSYTVDNNKISTDTTNVTVEFDYYDDGSNNALSGQYVQFEYLSTEGVKKDYISLACDNSWKTAKFELTDAKFDKADGISGADFRIGVSSNRGGLGSTYVKVYKTGAVSAKMPQHVAGVVVNDAGTAFEGDLILRRWYDPSKWSNADSYDRMIIFNGETGLPTVEGKTYTYNERYEYPSGKSWAEWRNTWHFGIPDEFLYGTNYEKVEVEIEYYAPNGTGNLNLFVNKDATKYTTSVEAGKWVKQVFTITNTDGKNAEFSNGWYSNDAGGNSDIKIMFESCQAYIHSVTIRKDIIED